MTLARAKDADGALWESEVDDAICSIAITPDNSLLAVGSEGGEILLRQLGPNGGREQRLPGHDGGTMALSWVAPPAAAVPGRSGWAQQAHAAYVRSGGRHAAPAARYAALCASYGAPQPPPAQQAQAQPHGGWILVSSGADGHVRAWDGATGRLLCAQPCTVGNGASSPGGVSGAAGAWVMNVDSQCTTVDGLPAIRYLATVGKHVLNGVLVPEPQPDGQRVAKLAARPADAEVLGPLDKTVDCASFCSDGTVVACCYGGVAVWGPRGDSSQQESDRQAPRKFSYKGWLVRLAPSPGDASFP